jgi:predicted DNA-binding protein YlxM (UPF0122 family)
MFSFTNHKKQYKESFQNNFPNTSMPCVTPTPPEGGLNSRLRALKPPSGGVGVSVVSWGIYFESFSKPLSVMKWRPVLLCQVCIFFMVWAGSLSAQHTMGRRGLPLIVKRNVAFIVRKPDRARNLAVRFHVPFKALAKLNRSLRKKQIMYAGKSVVLPVWLKRKSTARYDDFNMADYELDMDSVDYYVKEDFISMVEIEADTVRRTAIGKEIKRIDARIEAINVELDSIEKNAAHDLSMREIKKLPLARFKHAGIFAIGVQIDSLAQVKSKISKERAKLDLIVCDYECLVENARYNSSHTRSGDIKPYLVMNSGSYTVKGGIEKNKKLNNN